MNSSREYTRRCDDISSDQRKRHHSGSTDSSRHVKQLKSTSSVCISAEPRDLVIRTERPTQLALTQSQSDAFSSSEFPIEDHKSTLVEQGFSITMNDMHMNTVAALDKYPPSLQRCLPKTHENAPVSSFQSWSQGFEFSQDPIMGIHEPLDQHAALVSTESAAIWIAQQPDSSIEQEHLFPAITLVDSSRQALLPQAEIVLSQTTSKYDTVQEATAVQVEHTNSVHTRQSLPGTSSFPTTNKPELKSTATKKELMAFLNISEDIYKNMFVSLRSPQAKFS
jgi:hypothetical protein